MALRAPELYSVMLHESALPGRSNYGFTQDEVATQLSALNIPYRNSQFSPCGQFGGYNVLELLPQKNPQKCKVDSEIKNIPRWLPQLIERLSEQGISLFVTASLDKKQDLQGQIESIYNLEHLSITQDSTDENLYKIILPARQLFSDIAEPFTVALIRATLKRFKNSAISLEEEICASLADFTLISHPKALELHSSKLLESKTIRLQTLLSNSPTILKDEDTQKASLSLTRLIHELEGKTLQKFTHGHVWTFSDPDLLMKIPLRMKRGVKLDPQEIVPVYANTAYLSETLGNEFTTLDAHQFLANNAAYLLKDHIRQSPHDLLPRNIKWVKRSTKVYLPEFHVHTYLQDNGFVAGASRAMFLPIQPENGKTQTFDIKGVGSINPKDISDRDGILRAESGLRELFVNHMICAYLEIPSVKKNISEALSRFNLNIQGVKIEHIACSGVIGLLFVPSLKTNVTLHLPSTNFGALLIRPIQPGRIFINDLDTLSLTNIIEDLIFAPLGLSSDLTGPNIQGYVDADTNTLVLIDFGTAESGMPQTVNVSPPIFKNPLATDRYLTDLSHGLIQGLYSPDDIEKILQHLKRWVLETYA